MFSKGLVAIIVVFTVVATAISLSMSSAVFHEQVQVNSSFVTLRDGVCSQCSAGVSGFVYSMLQSQGYSSRKVALTLGSKAGQQLISNYLVTALPSVVFPATSSSASILSSLIYLNVFNTNQNHFVLNTPFLSVFLKNVTYYSIIQNRTITSFDVYNITKVYNISVRKPWSAIINPMVFLLEANATNMTYGNKTQISFVYSDSPFSAMQDLILEQALQNFGAFSALQTAASSRVQLSPGEYLWPQPFYVFPSGSYTSGFFYLRAYNLTTLSDPSVMKELFQYDQNQGSVLGTTYGVFSPFLDIGGKYISASSMLQPTIFDNLTMGEVYSKIKSNTTIGTAFNDSVDFLDAVLCSYTGGIQSVCKSNPVLRQASYIESQV